ncbi:protein MNN4-like [Papaver somniferum]|uniref:protein MNN4-like n=1 Tax=Papaver somniferum TaxID=3469 RepID=UPI000E704543|nr:protein MNN4-like [Papaver somniferum]
MAENASSSANGNHNEPPPNSDAMVRAKLTIGTLSISEIERLIPFLNQEKIRKKEQEEREEFERLRVENDEEFQLWMRKLDAKKARRQRQKLQRRGEWKCSWGKTRSATESDSEDEEKNREGVEDEESSDDSMKRDESKRSREEEEEKKTNAAEGPGKTLVTAKIWSTKLKMNCICEGLVFEKGNVAVALDSGSLILAHA